MVSTDASEILTSTAPIQPSERQAVTAPSESVSQGQGCPDVSIAAVSAARRPSASASAGSRGPRLQAPAIPPAEIRIAPGQRGSGFMATAELRALFPVPPSVVFSLLTNPGKEMAFQHVLELCDRVEVTGLAEGSGNGDPRVRVFEETQVGETSVLWHHAKFRNRIRLEEDASDPRVLVQRLKLLHGDTMSRFDGSWVISPAQAPLQVAAEADVDEDELQLIDSEGGGGEECGGESADEEVVEVGAATATAATATDVAATGGVDGDTGEGLIDADTPSIHVEDGWEDVGKLINQTAALAPTAVPGTVARDVGCSPSDTSGSATQPAPGVEPGEGANGCAASSTAITTETESSEILLTTTEGGGVASISDGVGQGSSGDGGDGRSSGGGVTDGVGQGSSGDGGDGRSSGGGVTDGVGQGSSGDGGDGRSGGGGGTDGVGQGSRGDGGDGRSGGGGVTDGVGQGSRGDGGDGRSGGGGVTDGVGQGSRGDGGDGRSGGGGVTDGVGQGSSGDGGDGRSGGGGGTDGGGWCLAVLKHGLSPKGVPALLRPMIGRMVRAATEASLCKLHEDLSELVKKVLQGASVDEAMAAARDEHRAHYQRQHGRRHRAKENKVRQHAQKEQQQQQQQRGKKGKQKQDLLLPPPPPPPPPSSPPPPQDRHQQQLPAAAGGEDDTSDGFSVMEATASVALVAHPRDVSVGSASVMAGSEMAVGKQPMMRNPVTGELVHRWVP
ncbi:hypothetical protein Vafri_6725 [Volvox africanus]|uniref:Uncharacterized protein n=1 Tax=Volvox africanus TaxID=51714 RepID=A0A8J4AZR7_9CHLO|nr:hypothetical protein Vafri_6725 [Volvox africanus]